METGLHGFGSTPFKCLTEICFATKRTEWSFSMMNSNWSPGEMLSVSRTFLGKVIWPLLVNFAYIINSFYFATYKAYGK